MKSLYKKQVFLYIGILVVTYVTMAFAIYVSLSDNYLERERNVLIKQGAKIRESMSELYYDGAKYSEFESIIQGLEDYMDAQVFFVNNSGKISMVSDGIGDFWIGRTITDKTVSLVLEGNITYVEGNIDGMFTDKVLTVGYPVSFGGAVQGGIFMCKSIPEIREDFYSIYKNIMLFMALVLVGGVILVLIFTRRIVKPITEMNKAARVIAEGNFNDRIVIKTKDEVGQLAESFNYMAQSLDGIEQSRRELISNISHDLRSPITSIQGFLGAIEDGTVCSDKASKYIGIALEETKRLSKMVENVMDMNKAQTGALELNKEDFSINDLIKTIVEGFEKRIRDKEIKVSLVFENEKNEVYADYDKISRVVQNLLDNALKFTPQKGSIVIETTLNGEKLMLSFKNSGEPLNDEQQQHIFDRFYKADSSRGEFNTGSGLGLSIVKELLKAHGEAISVSSGEDYNEFVFGLELSKLPE